MLVYPGVFIALARGFILLRNVCYNKSLSIRSNICGFGYAAASVSGCKIITGNFSYSLLFFIIGRILPKKWFDYNAFPYKAFDCEKDGKIYEKIAISKWQSKVPDMSRIFPKLMPKKRMVATDPDTLLLMVRETCIAELIHVLLSICGLFGIYIMPGVWGVLFYAAYFLLGNLPFILIQRYNRPRLVRIYEKKRSMVK